MAIAYVQSAGAGNPSVTSLSVAWSTATTVGDYLVECIVYYGAPSSVTAPSGWTLVSSWTDGTTVAYVYEAVNAASQSTASQTWSWTSTCAAAIAIAEYSGVATSSPHDTASGNPAEATGTSATVTCGSLTTANVNDLVLGFCCAAGSGTKSLPTSAAFSSPSSGFTLCQSQSGVYTTFNQVRHFAAVGLLDDIVAATGTYAPSATLTVSSASWNYIAVTLAVVQATTTINVSMTGGLVAGGSAPAATVYSPHAAGGVVVTGSAGAANATALAMGGGVVATGTAAVVRGTAIAMSGGVMTTGSAAGATEYNPHGGGPLALAGTAPPDVTYHPTATGGVLVTGAAIPGRLTLAAATGGVTLIGSAATGAASTLTASGGVQAVLPGNVYRPVMTGGPILTGSAPAGSVFQEAGGGVTVGGFMPPALGVAAAGGVAFAGTLTPAVVFAPSPSGGVVVTGSAGGPVALYSAAMFGGVVVTGAAPFPLLPPRFRLLAGRTGAVHIAAGGSGSITLPPNKGIVY